MSQSVGTANLQHFSITVGFEFSDVVALDDHAIADVGLHLISSRLFLDCRLTEARLRRRSAHWRVRQTFNAPVSAASANTL